MVTIRRKPELAFEAMGGITGEVTGEVKRLLSVLVEEMQRTAIQEALSLRHEDYLREAYLIPELNADIIDRSIMFAFLFVSKQQRVNVSSGIQHS
jgi:hypothetical protein